MSWLYDEAPPRGRFVALRQAAAQGQDEGELKDYALSCRNWTEWKGIMEALAGGEW